MLGVHQMLLLIIALAIFVVYIYVIAIYVKEKNEVKPQHASYYLASSYTATFAIIVQTEECLPIHLRSIDYFRFQHSCDCEVYVLSYRKPCTENPTAGMPHVYYSFNNTVFWSEGRNIMFRKARRRRNYIYYILIDDDVRLQYNVFTPKKWIDDKIPLFKIFTNFLLDYQPAGSGIDSFRVHIIAKQWHSKCKKLDTPLAYSVTGIDGMVHAFHRDAVDTVLPYNGRFDKICEGLSGAQVSLTFQIAFPGQYIFYIGIGVANTQHRATPRRVGCYGGNKDVGIRRQLVEDIRRRSPLQYKNHSALEKAMKFSFEPDTLCTCMDLPPRRSPIVPYRVMPEI